MYFYNKFRILVAVVLLCSICAFTPSVNQHCPSFCKQGSIAEPSKFISYEKHKVARNIQLNAVSPTANIALISSSIAILSGYHVSLFNKERNSSTKTWRQYQADTREDWSRHVRETDGWLYAIQSMRNAMVAQQFLATTVLSLLTLITGKMWDILRVTTGLWERRLLTVQICTISMTMLFSSYQFLQGVRLMTHAGFMFPVKNGTRVDNIMRKTQNCQWLGLRWMYISLAPIAWVVGGGRAFFAVSIMLFQFFRSIDKQPEDVITRDDMCVVDYYI